MHLFNLIVQKSQHPAVFQSALSSEQWKQKLFAHALLMFRQLHVKFTCSMCYNPSHICIDYNTTLLILGALTSHLQALPYSMH